LTRNGGIVAAAVVLLAAACGGGEGKVDAGEWCRLTARVDSAPDWDVITFDLADEWIESAPEDIRAMTVQAARVRRELAKDPKPRALIEAERMIAAYRKDHCSEDSDLS
jgi:hypothetical protein